jgi:hypothetical protein
MVVWHVLCVDCAYKPKFLGQNLDCRSSVRTREYHGKTTPSTSIPWIPVIPSISVTAIATDLCDIIGRMTIDVLPDVVLLELFDCYVNQVREEDSPDVTVESWRPLVHVCRNWRNVVFSGHHVA